MNAHKPITAKAIPLCLGKPAGVPVSSPLAGASAVTCSECDGSGETMILALDATREEVGYCTTCDGTGEVEATCETCSGKLVDGWCSDCEDYGLVFVERIAPGRIAA